MKRSLLFILALAALLSSQAATKRALVIGIGDYPATSGWAKINGDKDIPMVEEMLTANGFSKQNIVELKNQQATCAAICREFESLIAKSQKGDYVYIHFSGHGQQITDLNGDERANSGSVIDTLDEAWIPYDAPLEFSSKKYEGENHLVDDQINSFLHRLRQSVGEEGKIIVVADACHSGDATRADEDDKDEECYRGAFTIFSIPNIRSAVKRYTSIFKSEPSIPQTNIEKPQQVPIEWIYISACKDYQSNREFEGKGSLTTALYRNKELFNKLSTKDLFAKVKIFYNNPRFPKTQTPVLEVTSGKETDIFL